VLQRLETLSRSGQRRSSCSPTACRRRCRHPPAAEATASAARPAGQAEPRHPRVWQPGMRPAAQPGGPPAETAGGADAQRVAAGGSGATWRLAAGGPGSGPRRRNPRAAVLGRRTMARTKPDRASVVYWPVYTPVSSRWPMLIWMLAWSLAVIRRLVHAHLRGMYRSTFSPGHAGASDAGVARSGGPPARRGAASRQKAVASPRVQRFCSASRRRQLRCASHPHRSSSWRDFLERLGSVGERQSSCHVSKSLRAAPSSCVLLCHARLRHGTRCCSSRRAPGARGGAQGEGEAAKARRWRRRAAARAARGAWPMRLARGCRRQLLLPSRLRPAGRPRRRPRRSARAAGGAHAARERLVRAFC
jgi:hypothetical protein